MVGNQNDDWAWQTIWTKKRKPFLRDINPWREIDDGREDIKILESFSNDNVLDLDACFLSELNHRTWLALIDNSLPGFMREKKEGKKQWDIIEVRKLPLSFYIKLESCKKNQESPMSLYCLIWDKKHKKQDNEPDFILAYFIAGEYGLRIIDFENAINAIEIDLSGNNGEFNAQWGKFKNLFKSFNDEDLQQSLKGQFTQDNEKQKKINEDKPPKEKKIEITYIKYPPLGLFRKTEYRSSPNLKNPDLKIEGLYIWNHQSPEDLEQKRLEKSFIEIKRQKISGLEDEERKIIETELNKIDSDNWKQSQENAIERRKNNAWRPIYPKRSNDNELNICNYLITYLSLKHPTYKTLLINDLAQNNKNELTRKKPYVHINTESSDKPMSIWMKTLPFYSDYGINLFEVIDWRFGQPRRSRFLFSHEQFAKKEAKYNKKNIFDNQGNYFQQLADASTLIHDINGIVFENDPLKPEEFIDYLHFFCTNFGGEKGYFTLVEDFDEDINWYQSGQWQREEIKHIIKGKVGENESLLWPIVSIPDGKINSKAGFKALVSYGGSLFLATFEVDPSQESKFLIAMVDDIPLVKSNEAKPEPFPYPKGHPKYLEGLETHFKISEDTLGPGQVLREGYNGFYDRGGLS